MDGQRQAALALHGLQGPDRDWMLGQLGEAERAQVSRLLGELCELGIPREPIPVPAAPPRPMAAVDRVRAADAKRMRQLLRDEPEDFVAALLAIESWPWKAAYMARLPRARRMSLERALARRLERPAPGRLREALIVRMDEKGVRLNFRPKFTLTPIFLGKLWTRR